MSGLTEHLRSLGETVAAQMDLELVQVHLVKQAGRWYLRFLLDHPAGITIKQCEDFSRRIEPLIDAEDPIPHRYILEVSSAGLDRPLLKESDYERFRGREAEFRFYEPVVGRRRLTGILSGLKRESGRIWVELETADCGKVIFPIGAVARAKLVPDI